MNFKNWLNNEAVAELGPTTFGFDRVNQEVRVNGPRQNQHRLWIVQNLPPDKWDELEADSETQNPMVIVRKLNRIGIQADPSTSKNIMFQRIVKPSIGRLL